MKCKLEQNSILQAKIQNLIDSDNKKITGIEKDMLIYASLIAKRVYRTEDFIDELKKLDDQRDIILQLRDRTKKILDSLPKPQLDLMERE